MSEKQRDIISKVLVEVRAGAEPSWEAGRQSCKRSQQCGSHFGRESEAGESESALARPPDQGTVSTSCLFWESVKHSQPYDQSRSPKLKRAGGRPRQACLWSRWLHRGCQHHVAVFLSWLFFTDQKRFLS